MTLRVVDLGNWMTEQVPFALLTSLPLDEERRREFRVLIEDWGQASPPGGEQTSFASDVDFDVEGRRHAAYWYAGLGPTPVPVLDSMITAVDRFLESHELDQDAELVIGERLIDL